MLDKNGLTEAEYLTLYDSSKYPKPAVTVDIVVFREQPCTGKEVLLIRRGNHPYLGCWALPGGFAEQGETVEQGAARELLEETGVTGAELKLVGVYSKPGRDPRGWTISAAYAAVVPDASAVAGDDAAEVRWAQVKNVDGRYCVDCTLAFDHDDILAEAAKSVFG